jgi:hypothetical protein
MLQQIVDGRRTLCGLLQVLRRGILTVSLLTAGLLSCRIAYAQDGYKGTQVLQGQSCMRCADTKPISSDRKVDLPRIVVSICMRHHFAGSFGQTLLNPTDSGTILCSLLRMAFLELSSHGLDV